MHCGIFSIPQSTTLLYNNSGAFGRDHWLCLPYGLGGGGGKDQILQQCIAGWIQGHWLTLFTKDQSVTPHTLSPRMLIKHTPIVSADPKGPVTVCVTNALEMYILNCFGGNSVNCDQYIRRGRPRFFANRKQLSVLSGFILQSISGQLTTMSQGHC